MDAPTAALIGATLGVVGTLTTAMLNPFSAARHTRAARNLELRREAYAAGLAVLDEMTRATDESEFRRAVYNMLGPGLRMQLVASPDVADLYTEVREALGAWTVSTNESEADRRKLFAKYTQAQHAFLEAARADLGIDD